MISGPARSRLALGAGLAGGAAADRLLGDPARWHPVAGFGWVAGGLERSVWRPQRAAGALYTGLLVGGVAVLAAAADRRLRQRPLGRAVLAAGITWCTLGGRSLGREATRLADAVRAGDLPQARRILPSLAGRDPFGLPAGELCRAAIESVAENTADAVVGPLVWGALAGPAGAAAYRAANTLDAMVGHRSDRYLRFGWASARLDDVLTWPAARIGALLAVALAPVATPAPVSAPLATPAPVRGPVASAVWPARVFAGVGVPGDMVRGGAEARRAAWETLRRDGRAHPSPNAGRMEAAFAGALGVGLGGRNRYGDLVEDRPRIGSGRPPAPGDVDAAVRLAAAVGQAATCLCVLWVLAASVVRRAAA